MHAGRLQKPLSCLVKGPNSSISHALDAVGRKRGEDRRIFHHHGALVLGAQERSWAASVSQGLGRRTAEAHAGGVAYVSV